MSRSIQQMITESQVAEGFWETKSEADKLITKPPEMREFYSIKMRNKICSGQIMDTFRAQGHHSLVKGKKL